MLHISLFKVFCDFVCFVYLLSFLCVVGVVVCFCAKYKKEKIRRKKSHKPHNTDKANQTQKKSYKAYKKLWTDKFVKFRKNVGENHWIFISAHFVPPVFSNSSYDIYNKLNLIFISAHFASIDFFQLSFLYLENFRFQGVLCILWFCMLCLPVEFFMFCGFRAFLLCKV